MTKQIRKFIPLAFFSLFLVYIHYANSTQQQQQQQPRLWSDNNKLSLSFVSSYYGHSTSLESMDLERQLRIDHELAHVGTDTGKQQLLDDKNRRIQMTAIDTIMVNNEFESLDDKLAAKEDHMLNTFEEEDNREKEPQIVILSACDNHDSDIVSKALENRNEYAKKHGYNHHFVDLNKFSTDESVVWLKIPAIVETFEKYPDAEWIWWLDMDALIMNMDLKIGDHVLKKSALEKKLAYGHPLRNTTSRFEGHAYLSKGEIEMNKIDFVISQDALGLNAGSFFIRRSYFSDLLLDLWSDPALVEQNFERQEQDALIYLLLTHKTLLNHVGLVPQRLINSYHDSTFSRLWRYRPGDFVIHFAGLNAEKNYQSLWQQYHRMLTSTGPEDGSRSPNHRHHHHVS